MERYLHDLTADGKGDIYWATGQLDEEGFGCTAYLNVPEGKAGAQKHKVKVSRERFRFGLYGEDVLFYLRAASEAA